MSAIKHAAFDDEGNPHPEWLAALRKRIPTPSPLASTDPYDDQQLPALHGSMWAPDVNGQKKPIGEVKTRTITPKQSTNE